MPKKLEAVRVALRRCFPDRPPQEINDLAEKDESVKYALDAFTPDEIILRAMLVSMSPAPSAALTGFLWCTTRRLLFVGAIRAFFAKTRPVLREWPYTSIQSVQFQQGPFRGARMSMSLVERAERITFESIVRNDLLQAFVADLSDYVQRFGQGQPL